MLETLRRLDIEETPRSAAPDADSALKAQGRLGDQRA
jgi:hypothetical protein